MSIAAAPKRSLTDKLADGIGKFAGPLLKFGDLPSVAAVQNGLIATMPIIIISSFFLILYVFGSPSVGSSGAALLPFLAPWAGFFVTAHQLLLGFMALYASVAIAMNYAERLGVEVKTAAMLGLGTFLLFTSNGLTAEGALDVTAFSASGLFPAIVSSLVSVRLYKVLVDRNIRIRMPDSVPPNIANAFTALIPFLAVFAIAWLIRTVVGFNLVAWFGTALAPIISGSDNIWVYGFNRLLTNMLWAVGLHGDNMLSPIFTPLNTIWTQENADAQAAGLALPHVWTLYGVDRLTHWPATVWPVIALMFVSKVRSHRALAAASSPAALFTIIEPVVYGLPIALNPFLIIPFILSGVVAGFVSYLAFSLNLVERFYASMPWATPPFLLGPLGTGDWKTIPLVVLVFFIGLVIYLPFFKVFERHELAKQAEIAAAQAAEEADTAEATA